ncbi:unnamed protein product [Parajaminaea phylloscopi]
MNASQGPPAIQLSASATQSSILGDAVAQSSSLHFPGIALDHAHGHQPTFTLPKLDTVRLDDRPRSHATSATADRSLSQSDWTATNGAGPTPGSGSKTANFFAASPVSSPMLRSSSGANSRASIAAGAAAAPSDTPTSQRFTSSAHLTPASASRPTFPSASRSSYGSQTSIAFGQDNANAAERFGDRADPSQIRPPSSSSSRLSSGGGSGGGGVGSRYTSGSIRAAHPGGDDDGSALTSASSTRSRRNWDEFEGKPVLALPSPAAPNDTIEAGDSMFVDLETLRSAQHHTHADAPQPRDGLFAQTSPPRSDSTNRDMVDSLAAFRAPLSSIISPQMSPGHWAVPSSSAVTEDEDSRSATHDRQHSPNPSIASKTSHFFQSHGPSSPPLPPPPRARSTQGQSRSSSVASRHVRNASQQSNASTSWSNTPWPQSPPAVPSPAQTTFPSLPSIASSVCSSIHASPATAAATLPNLSRPSRFPTLQSKHGPISGIDATPRTPDSESGLTSPIGNTMNFWASPRSDDAYLGVGLGPPPDVDSNGRSSQRRHVHGPSENATGSSLVPSVGHSSHFSGGAASHDMDVEHPDGDSMFSNGHSSLASASSSSAAGPLTASLALSAAASTDRAQTPKPSAQVAPPASGATDSHMTILGDETGVSCPEESEDEGANRVGRYEVQRTLGVGAFSRVVLAVCLDSHAGSEDQSGEVSTNGSVDGDQLTAVTTPAAAKKKSSLSSWSKAFRIHSSSSKHKGLANGNDGAHSSASSPSGTHNRSSVAATGECAASAADDCGSRNPRVVALKMMAREPCEQNERMRVSWVREVEVLKHIRHPSLIEFVHSFSTPKHHVLVLQRVAGGELFDLLATHHGELSRREWLVRRLFSELANAVGWMHSIHLVHRDIKLENILLTRSLFAAGDEAGAGADALRPSSLGEGPLLKLSDFGLSRFIDPAKPLLETRCGSEEYASPELIIGKKYDGRKTDVWAMGVVLYALVCGNLPFIDGDSAAASHPREGRASVERDAKERKAHLLRIAKGDLRWPATINDDSLDKPQTATATATGAGPTTSRLVTPFAKHIVSRLLRRDATKRCQAWDCFEDPWLTHGSFHGTGGEESAQGEATTLAGGVSGMPPSPLSDAGQRWLREHAEVKAGEVGTLASHD